MLQHSMAPGRWRAELALEYERLGERTTLVGRRHDGPLQVQKPLYPEGDAVCYTIVVHPPGGIAGGDELEIKARVGQGARALLTTPGAAKWYRSGGARARQRIAFDVRCGACLEWLPQETIVFNRARAESRTEVLLGGDACFIGWEILCFGRTGSGERFTQGEWQARTWIERDGKPLWLERARFEGGGVALTSAAVMGGQPVAGILLAAFPGVEENAVVPCRKPVPVSGQGAVTALPGLLAARYLGPSSEAAKRYFIQLWRILRPLVAGREAREPRIWRT